MYSREINKLNEIQDMRERMIQSANEYGISSKETIQCSQELDKLIYEYQCSLKDSQSTSTTSPQQEVKIVMKQMMLIWPKALLSI